MAVQLPFSQCLLRLMPELWDRLQWLGAKLVQTGDELQHVQICRKVRVTGEAVKRRKVSWARLAKGSAREVVMRQPWAHAAVGSHLESGEDVGSNCCTGEVLVGNRLAGGAIVQDEDGRGLEDNIAAGNRGPGSAGEGMHWHIGIHSAFFDCSCWASCCLQRPGC